MSRIAWMLVGGLAVLAIQAPSTADDRIVELFVSSGDCSKGLIEARVDCLTRQVEQIKARLDGRFGEVVPLGPVPAPSPAPVTPTPVRPQPR
jgi:hypothetical protein